MKLQPHFVGPNAPTTANIGPNNSNRHNGVPRMSPYRNGSEEVCEFFFPHPSSLRAFARQHIPSSHTSHAQFIRTYETSWTTNTPHPSTAPLDVPYSITTGTSAAHNHNSADVELPRHKHPLYSSIPLPGELIGLHPLLQYGPQSEWNVPNSSSGSCCHHWSLPATTPSLEALTIILPWLNMKLNVEPSSFPTPMSPCDGIVTVRDVLTAIDGVMDIADIGSSMGPSCRPEMLDSWGRGTRRCACVREVVSLEYLRHRCGRAGLMKADGESNTWVLRVG